jgi:holo-[acyl-carrier protein] synthase
MRVAAYSVRMIVGFGLDVVETARIARMLAHHGSRFRERVFTAAELDECRERLDEAQALAARFAAKEACLKALGTGWRRGFSFRDVEVVRTDGGAPTLRLGGGAAIRAKERGVRAMHVSLTHEPGLAAAAVILEA